MVKVYAPASSANMSVGFDVLGAAVTPVDGALLGDVVTVEAAETFSLNNLGRFADKLPSEPRENIVYQCWERFCQELGKQIPVAMTLEKNMPIGSGLGSSACSVVAALMAMNEHCGKPLNDTRSAGFDGRAGRTNLRQHSLRQRGTVFSWWYAVDDRRKRHHQPASARV